MFKGANKRIKFGSRVGLDIGSRSIKGVEVIERGPELVVKSAGSVDIPGATGKTPAEPSAIIHAIKSLWSTAGFESNQVVLALPPQATYMKWLHLEAPTPEELDQVAKSAAIRGAPFPASDAIADYRILDSRGTMSGNVHFMLLVAASSRAIDELLDIAEGAGLEPIAVDICAAASLRNLELQKRAASLLWSGQPLTHCLIGAKNTIITVVRGNALEFARTVPVGGNDFTECIVESTGLSWQEAENIKLNPGTRINESGIMTVVNRDETLNIQCNNAAGRLAREIQRSLRFFRSQFAEGSYLGMIGAAYLSGGGSLLKGLDTYLEQQGIDVTSIINPFAGFSVDAGGNGIQNVSQCAAAYTTAVGLAIGDKISQSEEIKAAS